MIEKALIEIAGAERANPHRSAPCRRMTSPNWSPRLGCPQAAAARFGALHVQGSATYIDDIREPVGTLHVAIGMADKASGESQEP